MVLQNNKPVTINVIDVIYGSLKLKVTCAVKVSIVLDKKNDVLKPVFTSK